MVLRWCVREKCEEQKCGVVKARQSPVYIHDCAPTAILILVLTTNHLPTYQHFAYPQQSCLQEQLPVPTAANGHPEAGVVVVDAGVVLELLVAACRLLVVTQVVQALLVSPRVMIYTVSVFHLGEI